MANSLDFDGRGPTDQQLVALGAAVLLIAGLITGSLLLKSTGRLNDYIRVVAELTNVGDGLRRGPMSNTTGCSSAPSTTSSRRPTASRTTCTSTSNPNTPRTSRAR